MGLVTVSTSQHSTPPWLTDCLLYPYHVTHTHTHAPQYTVEYYKVLPNSEKPRRRSDEVSSPGITTADRNSQKAEGCLDLWILPGQRSKSALFCLPATQMEGKRPNSKYVVAFPDPVTGLPPLEPKRLKKRPKAAKAPNVPHISINITLIRVTWCVDLLFYPKHKFRKRNT